MATKLKHQVIMPKAAWGKKICLDYTLSSSMAKVFATKKQHVDNYEAVQIHGGWFVKSIMWNV